MPKDGQMLCILSDGTAQRLFVGTRQVVETGVAIHAPPHGRLGDLDEIYKKVTPSELVYGEIIYAEDIIAAPTIIPANGVGE